MVRNYSLSIPGSWIVTELSYKVSYKNHNKGEKPTYLKTYIPGESFGELALLYNAPRAASVFAKTDCICWVLDRDTFNHVVKGKNY